MMMQPHSAERPIRVILVDDSPVAIFVLKRMLADVPDIEVVGTAANGKEGLKLVSKLAPDVICTDLHMPVMDGLEFTRAVMHQRPTPILVISISVSEDKTSNIFNLLQAGAVDVLAKPREDLQHEDKRLASELVRKIRIASGIVMFSRHTSHVQVENGRAAIQQSREKGRVIVIGSSTGGPQALATLFPVLPSDFQLPIICVQHITHGFLPGLIDWLNRSCKLTVSEAKEGELPQPGHVYFSREDAHLVINSNGRFAYQKHDGHGVCPSVDITMRSVADHYGRHAIGVLLTGMGDDGARGMLEIVHSGGLTIAQDEASCIVFGMPKQAIEIGAAQHILSLEGIAKMLHDIATHATLYAGN